MPQPDVAALRASFDGAHETVRTSDGKTLFVRRWGEPSFPVSVLIFHGITGHAGVYGPLIGEELASSGICVYAMDLRGHGLSDGRRGDYPSSERLAADLSETISLLRPGSKKLVVLGHSLGALSAIVAVNSRQEDLDGLVLLSVGKGVKKGAYPKPTPGAVARALLAASILRSTPLIEYRREGMRGQDDPLFNFRYSARFYTVIYGTGALAVSRMMREGTLDAPNMHVKGELHIPVLLGIGDQDELFSVESAREFLESIPAKRKELLVIPGGHHASFPAHCWGPLSSWIQAL